MKPFRLIAALCCLLFAPAAVSAQTAPSGGLLGNPIFQKNCAKCHGKTAEGRHFGGPSLSSAKVITTSSDDMLNIISNGKGRMPKYAGKLTADEITTLVQQIKSFNNK